MFNGQGVPAARTTGDGETALLRDLSPSEVDRLSAAVQLPDDAAPTQVGPYRPVRAIGEGGMGVVYEAEQTHPIRRTVALKLIKLGMDSRQVIARFEAERQTLAMLNHPNVAKVLDAGTTDAGRPYFVMEHVSGGEPITAFCDRHRLTIRQRLELFIQACEAVQHAHQKAIIHRDLKPSNILVTLDAGKPVAKVIDFGVSKVLSRRLPERALLTEAGQLLGTPGYMSPEQTSGDALDVDTRTDVYALGVVLYELVCGALPVDPKLLRGSGFEEIRRIIRETEPSRLAVRLRALGERAREVATHRRATLHELTELLDGELGWIPLKALRRDRAQRYASVSELISDVGNYLHNRPLAAGPESRAYRARKFLRRNRAAVAAALAVGFALLAGVVGTTAGLIHAQAQRREAQAQSAIARAVSQFQSDMLASADPQRLLGDTVTVLQATRQAVKQLNEGAFGDQPLADAAVRATIGNTLRALAHYDEAEPLLVASLTIRQANLPPDDPAIAASHSSLASLRLEQGKYGDAERHYRAASEIGRKVQPAQRSLAESLHGLALALKLQGKLAEAESFYREALAIHRELLGSAHADTAANANNLALLLYGKGRFDEAESLFREALNARRAALPVGHPDIAASLNGYGELLRAQGKLADAEPLYREALDIRRRALPAAHPSIAASLNNLAELKRAQGNLDEAEPLYREALATWRGALPPEHPHVALGLSNVASLLRDQGKLDEAESLYREALAINRAALPAGHVDIATNLSNIAALLKLQGRSADAEELFRQCLEMYRKALPPEHPFIAAILFNLAPLVQAQGQLGEAESLYREALDIRRKALPARHPLIATSMIGLVDALRAQGRFAEAEPLLRDVLDAQRASLPAGHPDIATSLIHLASLSRELGDLAEAEALFREALESYRRALPAEHPRIGATLNNLVWLLHAQGKLSPAEPLLREALELWQKAPPSKDPQIFTNLYPLARVLADQGRLSEAEPLFAELYRMSLAASIDPKQAARFASMYGPVLVKLGRYQDAEPPLREAIERLRGTGQATAQEMHAVLASMADVCDHTNRPGEAAKWRAELEALKVATQPATAPLSAPSTMPIASKPPG